MGRALITAEMVTCPPISGHLQVYDQELDAMPFEARDDVFTAGS